jgi:DNA invertase Pin-like site-specific DNA recombinase
VAVVPRREHQWHQGRDKRPELDALLKGVARREFDIVAAWSVCRRGRSLSDLIGLLGELRSREIDRYLHQRRTQDMPELRD